MSANGRSILLVDDDQEIRELLETYLSRAGFQVRSVSRGADFRQALCEEEASLAILDVMLPDEDGFSLCRWIRSHQRLACMPIIMLTASSDEADRVIGLELGADDYLGKPFSPRELLARIKALLRRAQFTQVRGGDVLAFEDWRLDTVSHRLFHEDGEEFFLSGADFALLCCSSTIRSRSSTATPSPTPPAAARCCRWSASSTWRSAACASVCATPARRRG